MGVDKSTAKAETISGIASQQKGGYFSAVVPMKICNLAAVATRVLFGPIHLNVLGRHDGLSHFRTTFTWNKIHYEEMAQRAASAALAQSYAVAASKSYRNTRI